MEFEEILDLIDSGAIEDLDQGDLLEALLVMRNHISQEIFMASEYEDAL